jgi:putative acyl-CoA dehydrogenase
MAAPFDTHEVLNQSPPFEDVDLFALDRPLKDALAANGGAGEAAELSAFGRRFGSAEMLEQARLANDNPPRLRSFDVKGFRRDVVEFHPAYHRCMAESIAAGVHAMTWRPSGQRAAAPAEVTRAARFYLANQVEAGHCCPITMTARRSPRSPPSRRCATRCCQRFSRAATIRCSAPRLTRPASPSAWA